MSGQTPLGSGASPAGAAAAFGEERWGTSAMAKLDDFLGSRDDYQQKRRVQQELLKKKQAHEQAQRARAAVREVAQQEAAQEAEQEEAAQAMTARIRELGEQMVPVNLEEYRETMTVLVPLPPRDAEADDIDLDACYLQELSSAAADLGVVEYLAEEGAQQDAFRVGLRGGYVRSMAVRRGAAGRPLVEALFGTMTKSPNSETAGAAFVTLMALLGEGAGPDEREGDAAAAGLMLDAHYGLPAAAAAGSGGTQPPPACQLDCIPTDAQLLEALRDNGYRPEEATAGGSGRGARGQRQPRHQQHAAEAAGGSPQQAQQEAQPGGLLVRLQAVKLIMRTAAAVCRYCKKHPPAAAAALSREGVSDLLLAALQLQLDPSAGQLQEELDVAAAALADALDDADWQRKLPQLAERLAELGPSHAARLKLLHKLPASQPRLAALQQLGGALLLERLLPPGHKLCPAAGRSAVDRRNAAALNPAAVVSAQPWFSDPKALVTSATSGGAQPPRGGYSITVVELLLKTCNLLLWPHMLAHAAGEPSCLSTEFLTAWHAFLSSVQLRIKSMQTEDRNVKVIATQLDLEYYILVEGAGPRVVE